MKSIKLQLILCITILVALSSCSLEKRVYRQGYHIDWKNGKNKNEKLEFTHSIPEHEVGVKESAIVKTPDNTTEAVKNIVIANSENGKSVLPPVISAGSEIVPVTNENLKNTIQTNPQSENKISTKKIKSKKASGQKSSGGGKNQIVALILCIFLGYLGIHRFYLGYTGLGVLYLLTLGLFGIGWFIDTILLIIPNGLTPKGKTSYDE